MFDFLKQKYMKLDVKKIIEDNVPPEMIEKVENKDRFFDAVNDVIKAGAEEVIEVYNEMVKKCVHPEEDCPIKKIHKECETCKEKDCQNKEDCK